MSQFPFDPALLERCERYRLPTPDRPVPGETEAERDRRRKMDLAHRQTQRENLLQDLHAEYAESIGMMIAKRPAPIAALIFGKKNPYDHGEVPEAVAKLEATAVSVIHLRTGPGAGVNDAALYHSPLPRAEVEKAVLVLNLHGARASILPFSFVNIRALTAVLVQRASRSER